MSNAGTIKDNKHYMNEMIACYREEAIECVKDHVLQIHKQIYAKYNGDFDRIYTEGYNSKSYIYILSQLEPDSHFEVRIENTILKGSDRCTFRITKL